MEEERERERERERCRQRLIKNKEAYVLLETKINNEN